MTARPASLALAVDYFRRGQLAEAHQTCQQLLQQTPAPAAVHHLLGLIHQRQAQSAQAAAQFTLATQAEPANARHWLHLGIVQRALGETDAALAALRHAQQLDSTLADAVLQEANVLKSLGRYIDALPLYRKFLEGSPQSASGHYNLGVALLETNSPHEAIAHFRHALAAEPERPEVLNTLGSALLTIGQLSAAHEALTAATRVRPNYFAALDNLGRLYKAAGTPEEAIPSYRAALAARPVATTHSNLLFALNYLADATPASTFTEHRRWHEQHAASLTPPTATRVTPPPAKRRLRIGYLSPDFAHHAVAYFFEPVLAAHDRTRVEIFCYANVLSPDTVTERLRQSAEHWRDIARLSDDDTAAVMRADELDLLIDLAGHTAGHRLLVMARRPAPVQATWIGYPNTTGLDAIDYRITDAIADPVGTTEQFHSEKLVRLPANFSCYRPDEHTPAVNPLPALATGHITFGCLNNVAKVTPIVIATWARLLCALPNARLILKSRSLGDPWVAARLHAAFARGGVSAERVTLLSEKQSVFDHLSLYHTIDIALDPFPYNGTTTTCEALWMGVPVITLAGKLHAGRVGASLLTHAGLAEWITTSVDDYVACGTSVAQNWPALSALRVRLREQFHASPLCAAGSFTRQFEVACCAMAKREY